jgi:hypothetical protein
MIKILLFIILSQLGANLVAAQCVTATVTTTVTVRPAGCRATAAVEFGDANQNLNGYYAPQAAAPLPTST